MATNIAAFRAFSYGGEIEVDGWRTGRAEPEEGAARATARRVLSIRTRPAVRPRASGRQRAQPVMLSMSQAKAPQASSSKAPSLATVKIGRASCRERVCQYV